MRGRLPLPVAGPLGRGVAGGITVASRAVIPEVAHSEWISEGYRVNFVWIVGASATVRLLLAACQAVGRHLLGAESLPV